MLVVALFSGTCHSLVVHTTGRGNAQLSRRAAFTGFAALGAAPLAAVANTAPELDTPMERFDIDAEKRAAFKAKNKAYKKAWRKELSNLEFASNDAEAEEAIDALIKLIRENGTEIPEGVRKMDLDQVYRAQKDKLTKPARMKCAIA